MWCWKINSGNSWYLLKLCNALASDFFQEIGQILKKVHKDDWLTIKLYKYIYIRTIWKTEHTFQSISNCCYVLTFTWSTLIHRRSQFETYTHLFHPFFFVLFCLHKVKFRAYLHFFSNITLGWDLRTIWSARMEPTQLGYVQGKQLTYCTSPPASLIICLPNLVEL